MPSLQTEHQTEPQALLSCEPSGKTEERQTVSLKLCIKTQCALFLFCCDGFRHILFEKVTPFPAGTEQMKRRFTATMFWDPLLKVLLTLSWQNKLDGSSARESGHTKHWTWTSESPVCSDPFHTFLQHHSHHQLLCAPHKNVSWFYILTFFVFFKRKCKEEDTLERLGKLTWGQAPCQSHHLSAPSLSKSTQSYLLGRLCSTVFHVLWELYTWKTEKVFSTGGAFLHLPKCWAC